MWGVAEVLKRFCRVVVDSSLSDSGAQLFRALCGFFFLLLLLLSLSGFCRGVKANISIRSTHTYTSTYSKCVCVCVCLCGRFKNKIWWKQYKELTLKASVEIFIERYFSDVFFMFGSKSPAIKRVTCSATATVYVCKYLSQSVYTYAVYVAWWSFNCSTRSALLSSLPSGQRAATQRMNDI